MAPVRGQAAEVVAGVSSRIDAWGRRVRRTSVGPAVVRLCAAGAGLVALLVAIPSQVLTVPGVVGACFLVALGVGVAPRSRWVTVVVLLAAAAWIYTTLAYGEQLVLWRLAVLTCATYTMHTGAALAATLPYDAIISPGVLTRWVTRTAAMLGVGLTLGVGAFAVADRLHAVSTVVAPVLGLLAVAGVTVLLAWQWRRH
jgi:hypothetical protein